MKALRILLVAALLTCRGADDGPLDPRSLVQLVKNNVYQGVERDFTDFPCAVGLGRLFAISRRP